LGATPVRYVAHYGEILQAIREHIAELDITFESVDEIAGFPARYTSKLLCTPPIKTMSVHTMFALLGAIGLRIAPAADSAALEKLRRHSQWATHRYRGPQYRMKMHA
jgi:hypothetical protein